MRRAIVTLGAMSLALTGCTGGGTPDGAGAAAARTPSSGDAREVGGATGGTGSPGRVDPREGGLEVALGEWALTLESATIRPGRVTFVVANRGTMAHGFEIEDAEGDSSGPGGGDGLEAETTLLAPGERTRLTLDLGPGRYKVECLVEGHDDLGMEAFLEVRRDAPLLAAGPSDRGPMVSIAGFSFEPDTLAVAPGAEVTWTNGDETPHTVTAEDGSFDSGTLEPGQRFSTTPEGNGRVTYRCQIHPEMVGELIVG
ncbi:MAG TPA: plastocyanin/azurin family copper-binding protein [Actinomycetota bacterium]